MPVLVVHVRDVRMLVLAALVPMGVRVGFAGRAVGSMLMLVMLVVNIWACECSISSFSNWMLPIETASPMQLAMVDAEPRTHEGHSAHTGQSAFLAYLMKWPAAGGDFKP